MNNISFMNDPREFVKTIYLGDRACYTLIIDGRNRRISLVINTISRIRDPSGNWNYYTDEDIEDGRIVFESVSSFTLEPQGFIPSDWIDIVRVEPLANASEKENFIFTISLGAIDDLGHAQEVTVKIIAEGLYLEDPSRPGIKIRE